MHACTQRGRWVQIHTYMDTCVKTHTVNIYTQRYIHKPRDTYIHAHGHGTYIYTYVHAHRCAHKYTDANTQIHTHRKQVNWCSTRRFMHVSCISVWGACNEFPCLTSGLTADAGIWCLQATSMRWSAFVGRGLQPPQGGFPSGGGGRCRLWACPTVLFTQWFVALPLTPPLPLSGRARTLV